MSFQFGNFKYFNDSYSSLDKNSDKFFLKPLVDTIGSDFVPVYSIKYRPADIYMLGSILIYSPESRQRNPNLRIEYIWVPGAMHSTYMDPDEFEDFREDFHYPVLDYDSINHTIKGIQYKQMTVDLLSESSGADYENLEDTINKYDDTWKSIDLLVGNIPFLRYSGSEAPTVITNGNKCCIAGSPPEIIACNSVCNTGGPLGQGFNGLLNPNLIFSYNITDFRKAPFLIKDIYIQPGVANSDFSTTYFEPYYMKYSICNTSFNNYTYQDCAYAAQCYDKDKIHYNDIKFHLFKDKSKYV